MLLAIETYNWCVDTSKAAERVLFALLELALNDASL
jgi:hypothetical protein